jgi:MarR family transcriptional regulator for hemolysin
MRLHQHLGFLLDSVADLYARRFEERARELPLTLHQCKTLTVLANCEAMNQTKLAQISDIVPANLVRILDRLEAAGWVERRRDPRDRRAHLLSVTESARPVVRRIWGVLKKTNAEAFNGLPLHDRFLLMGILTRAHANLGVRQALRARAADPDDVHAAATSAEMLVACRQVSSE